ncbi:MAG: sulfatase-like hydrolase/transferase [Anaerolineaceae bacterium]|nr:sulfatase-like hydrolase/transferase [Anaerolineaceae bacterium]MDE0330182.1 sulfatase-like hydrolase/transferase [Anaerolineaceae bacterium]
MSERPNIVIIMSDQQRADVSAREGFALDTTPFLDALATEGVWFKRAYTSMPACLPARVSMLTGRYPGATRARTNHNGEDVTCERDLYQLLREAGYRTALCGKNHSHVGPDDMDHYFPLGHHGGFGPERTPAEVAFDDYLAGLRHRADFKPAPGGVEVQCPYRAVSSAIDFVDSAADEPFFLWLSFPEPHNPYQAPEPYFSLFPPDTLPPTLSDVSALEGKSFKYRWLRQIGETAFTDYAEQLPQARSNYFAILRLIDDQVRRFVGHLDARGLRDNTILFFLSDHGDYVGEYGLVRKGAELPEVLVRIPFQVCGPGILAGAEPHEAHVSIVDILPTLCEATGIPVPDGVQGRSLWPLLSGDDWPREEFASAYAEQGFGGLHYTEDDDFDPQQDGFHPAISFDELNGWTQSGNMRMLRRGDWKLLFDMQGRGQLYNLAQDPVELNDLYDDPACAAIRGELLAELLAWTLRAQDPLPHPRRRYRFKSDPRNYWSPYRES